MNGDGRADTAVTYYSGVAAVPEPGWSKPESVVIHDGSRSTLRPHGKVVLDGVPSTTLQQTAAAGDFNGDGYGDVLVAESYLPLSGPSYRAVLLFTGGRRGAGPMPVLIIEPGQTVGEFPYGDAVGRSGDVNGDGFDDFTVGAPLSSGGQQVQGSLYVFYGRPAVGGSLWRSVDEPRALPVKRR